jgi:predicted dehydrogenase
MAAHNPLRLGAVRGRSPLQIDAGTALHVVEILDAAYRSARDRHTVTVVAAAT